MSIVSFDVCLKHFCCCWFSQLIALVKIVQFSGNLICCACCCHSSCGCLVSSFFFFLLLSDVVMQCSWDFDAPSKVRDSVTTLFVNQSRCWHWIDCIHVQSMLNAWHTQKWCFNLHGCFLQFGGPHCCLSCEMFCRLSHLKQDSVCRGMRVVVAHAAWLQIVIWTAMVRKKKQPMNCFFIGCSKFWNINLQPPWAAQSRTQSWIKLSKSNEGLIRSKPLELFLRPLLLTLWMLVSPCFRLCTVQENIAHVWSTFIMTWGFCACPSNHWEVVSVGALEFVFTVEEKLWVKLGLDCIRVSILCFAHMVKLLEANCWLHWLSSIARWCWSKCFCVWHLDMELNWGMTKCLAHESDFWPSVVTLLPSLKCCCILASSFCSAAFSASMCLFPAQLHLTLCTWFLSSSCRCSCSHMHWLCLVHNDCCAEVQSLQMSGMQTVSFLDGSPDLSRLVNLQPDMDTPFHDRRIQFLAVNSWTWERSLNWFSPMFKSLQEHCPRSGYNNICTNSIQAKCIKTFQTFTGNSQQHINDRGKFNT